MNSLPASVTGVFYWIFPTKFNKTIAVSVGGMLAFLSFGHRTSTKAVEAWRNGAMRFFGDSTGEEREWNRGLFERIGRYLEGDSDDFRDLKVNLTGYTPFQQKILTACRRIPLGETKSYGELAAMAGVRGAARAAGTCMAKNRIPLIIPCHRVILSDGRLGNYSAVGGKKIKAELLENEKKFAKLACLE